MILYRLRCSKGHEFESWFKDSKTYERQEKKSLIGCAVCGEAKVARALMAPRLGKGGKQGRGRDAGRRGAGAAARADAGAAADGGARRHMPKELREALLKVRAEVEKNCEHVGDKFAEEARKIHYGESDKRGIYGETSDEEAEALADEGIEFGRLPWIPAGESDPPSITERPERECCGTSVRSASAKTLAVDSGPTNCGDLRHPLGTRIRRTACN